MTPDDPTRAALDRLTAELAAANARERLWRMLGLQVLRGLAFGLGSVMGATLLVSAIGWWLSHLDFLPLIGDWAARLAEEMTRARQ
jgi:hypothetical protein